MICCYLAFSLSARCLTPPWWMFFRLFPALLPSRHASQTAGHLSFDRLISLPLSCSSILQKCPHIGSYLYLPLASCLSCSHTSPLLVKASVRMSSHLLLSPFSVPLLACLPPKHLSLSSWVSHCEKDLSEDGRLCEVGCWFQVTGTIWVIAIIAKLPYFLPPSIGHTVQPRCKSKIALGRNNSYTVHNKHDNSYSLYSVI